MTFNKFSSIIIVFSLLSYSTFTDADGSPPLPNPGECPIDSLKLRDCVGFLGIVNYGNPPFGGECCALIEGLVDLEAASCICIALKTNVLGMNLNIPINLSVILRACQRIVPPEYECV
ncbi:unnamed protein product [Vicia faba]|uniref:Bifunctional inhibitor/plant lipid transfer protein/seed storage helical domain-containing protein n=1 Tax=Vicia faba TaxID=3906 RepID=A0AAV0ZLQ5_VICFA|nr:unnamed protein product [Vicia faba]